MLSTPQSIKLALQLMGVWLGLPESTYKATVYRFSYDLPPEQVLKAVQIAYEKIPSGGMDGFKYFCGVCNCMLREQRIRESLEEGA